MQILSDEDVQVERVWCGEEIGTRLIARHMPSGVSVERVIGFNDEGQHRRELQAQLLHRLAAEYPPEHFILEHLWLGPGKGASLRLRHVPSGTTVERFAGFEPVTRYRAEMVAELFEKLPRSEAG